MKTQNKEKLVPKYWYNIVPFLTRKGWKVPPQLDAKTLKPMKVSTLSKTLVKELAKQELNAAEYMKKEKIPIPKEIIGLYKKYRPTPLVRAKGLEKHLKLKKVKIYFKREDVSKIGSYKLNSAYPQAYYAKKEGVHVFVGDTGPGNWGMGMALACKELGLKAIIYMEEKNYKEKIRKVRVMEKFGAIVKPIITKQGTIAASISEAMKLVNKHPKNKLSLGCLTAYSALHNTVIGLELKKQLEEKKIHPDAMMSVVGGGSSFSGFIFPFIESNEGKTEFIAVESASVPSFTKGKYRYENPDLLGLMPRAKMYTLGVKFTPKKLGASGLNYHGKNPLLSLLVNKGIVKAVSYTHDEVDKLQKLFQRLEGIKPAAESCYAIKGAMEKAKEWNGQDKTIIFCLTGNAEDLNIYGD
jgi:tryptophan synthase beta chain